MKLKLFSMFSGYGGAEFALAKAGIDFETVGYSEIDKFAIQTYEQNHNGKNYGDATKINEKELPDFDLLTGGFPCQSFSNAGKGAGTCDSRGTLFWDIWRIAKEKKPKYMLLENVKGLTSKKHKETLDKILLDLKTIGYHVDMKVLNSKNFGIPQNRERVWFVCQREDIYKPFEWPEEVELKLFLKDILEDEVDEKYYLTEKNIKTLQRSFGSKGQDLTDKEYSNTLTTAMGTGGGNVPYLKQLNNPTHSNDRVYSPEGVSPTLNTMQGGNRQPFIAEEQTIRKLTPKECFRLMGFLDDNINLEGLSNSQQYKQAGNGWEINVVSKIFKNML